MCHYDSNDEDFVYELCGFKRFRDTCIFVSKYLMGPQQMKKGGGQLKIQQRTVFEHVQPHFAC